MTSIDLTDWDRAPFEHVGVRHEVLRRGSGHGVVVIPEFPGATPAVMAFADRLVDAGFRVAVASIVGEPGRPMSAGYIARSASTLCISREMRAFQRRADRPITAWLRGLARDLHAECGGPGVGVVGMCFSGGFALAAAATDEVLAPVISQPALPLPIGGGSASLGLSAREEDAIRHRIDHGGLCALGLRFTEDAKVPEERFAALERMFAEGWRAFEIDSSPGNAHGIPESAHSVLTDPSVEVAGHPTADAMAATVAFLRERLAPASA